MIIRKILTLLLILKVSISFSQTDKYYFLKFKVYEKKISSGVPFTEICLTNKKEDIIYKCTNTDFDGYVSFCFNSSIQKIDSIYFKIKILKGNKQNDYSNPIKISFNQISLMKVMTLEENLIISLIENKLIDEKKYKKYLRKDGLMQNRSESLLFKDIK